MVLQNVATGLPKYNVSYQYALKQFFRSCNLRPDNLIAL